jgi:hypothetical protein
MKHPTILVPAPGAGEEFPKTLVRRIIQDIPT